MRKSYLVTAAVLVVVAGLIIFFLKITLTDNANKQMINKQTNMTKILDLKSSAFADNEMIPSMYTCEGKNSIPPLQIFNVPANSKSLAIILDDPDAPMGTFTHWVVWNIPPETKEIEEGQETIGVLGKGSSGTEGYIGPCPPTGTHHYHFILFALDTTLSLEKGSSKQKLEEAMNGHILDEAELIGLYKKGM